MITHPDQPRRRFGAAPRLILLLLSTCIALGAGASSASAFDAGVSKVVLTDGTPGAVSRPFEVQISQTGYTPQPDLFRVAIEGFELDPGQASGTQIGSADYYTDLGEYLGNPITSNGDSGSGLTWNFDTGLGNPVLATVEAGKGLDSTGVPVATPDSTLVTFDLPETMPLGAKLQKLGLRFNQNWKNEPSAGVGAKNPEEAGSYLIRTWVKSVSPPGETSVASKTVTVGNPPKPKTALKVTASAGKVKAGRKINFTLRTTNGTIDTVEVWLGGRRIRTVKVGPKSKSFSWKAPRKLAGRKASFAFAPRNGATRRVSVKVQR